MKAYSLDLRQKISDVYEQEEISQRQLAKTYSPELILISLKTVGQKLKMFYVPSVQEHIKIWRSAIAYAYSQVSLKDLQSGFAHFCYCISPF